MFTKTGTYRTHVARLLMVAAIALTSLVAFSSEAKACKGTDCPCDAGRTKERKKKEKVEEKKPDKPAKEVEKPKAKKPKAKKKKKADDRSEYERLTKLGRRLSWNQQKRKLRLRIKLRRKYRDRLHRKLAKVEREIEIRKYREGESPRDLEHKRDKYRRKIADTRRADVRDQTKLDRMKATEEKVRRDR